MKKDLKNLPWLSIALGVVAIVLGLELYRNRLRSPEVPPMEIPLAPATEIRQCSPGDKKCVADMARTFAGNLERAGEAEGAAKLRESADALERGDCDAALKASYDVKVTTNDPKLIEGLAFFGEIVQICILDDYGDVLGDASALFGKADASIADDDDDTDAN